MELNRPANPNTWQAKLVTGIGRKFRSEKGYTEKAVQEKRKKETAKLQKKSKHPAPKVNELGEQDYGAVFGANTPLARPKRVKEADHGDMMHRLAQHGSFDSLLDQPQMLDQLRDPYFDSKVHRKRHAISEKHEVRVASFPDELWKRVTLFLDPVDAANLALASKTLYRKLGFAPFDALDYPANRNHKIAFLNQFDEILPGHLLCFPCAKYHIRLAPGKEQLKIEYVKFPVFACPMTRSSVLPRMRLTYGRELPYASVQLALRHAVHSPSHGIHHDTLSRRWKCKDSSWTHRTRYMVHHDRLLMRVVSQSFVPPASLLTETAERHILYDREEYTPFFSVCAHWKDGDLSKVCKCMMSHVPAPPDPYRKQLQRGFKLDRAAAHPDFIVRGCDECRPARRCPECPTEYMVEIRMLEDLNDKIRPFKHAIVVTRWSDLGDGSSPYTSAEWTAINGTNTGVEGAAYDSFTNIGRRAVSGIFESQVSGTTPGQRLISLNPKNKKMGEDGHEWY